MHHGKLPVFTNVSNIQNGGMQVISPPVYMKYWNSRKWKRISFKYHRTGQALWPMNPKPVKFLNSPCWRALHHVAYLQVQAQFHLILRVSQEERATDTFRRTDKMIKFSPSIGLSIKGFKKINFDLLKTIIGVEQYPSSPNIVSPIPTSKTKLSQVNPRECGNPTW